MKKDLIIIGTGLSAKQAFDFVKINDLFNIVGFSVDSKYKTDDKWLGYPVFELEKLKQYIDIEETLIYVALGWNRLNSDRKKLYLRLKAEGYKFANLISPLAVMRGSVVGENCWINDYVVLQSDAKIKSNVVIREGVVVGNGTVINEHCFLGVNAIIGGGAVIGAQTFVGIRGTVFDGRIVGEKCLVGACAFVKRNLPDYCVCKTVLDSIAVKEYDKEEIENKLVAGKNVK